MSTTPPYPPLSLCMIVKDEEDWIGRCIESVRSIVTEIIVVDTGSTDRTIEIATTFGAQILREPWSDDFSAPRNLSLSKATGAWILVLDADEIVAPADLPKIQNLTTLTPPACYELTQRHYSNDVRLSEYTPVKGEYPELEKGFGGYFQSSLVRLFPNNHGITYTGRVHELVEHSIRKTNILAIKPSGIILHHYGHSEQVQKKKNKTSLYTPLGTAKITEQPTDWKSWFELGVEHNTNGRTAQSAEALARAAELNPEYLSTWVNLGYVLCELGKYQESANALQRALALSPQAHEAHCNLGVVCLRIKKFADAELCFRRAVALSPQYINAWCNLGKALALQGRAPEAAHILKRTLETAPTHAGAKLDLAALYLQAKKVDVAKRYIKEVQELPALPEQAQLLLAELEKLSFS